MDSSFLCEIYTRISSLLSKNNISGTDFAPTLGLKKSPLTDWKNGKSAPTLEHIITICEFFGISADYIIWGKESSSNATPLISAHDRELLLRFHQLNHAQQERCIGYIDGMLAESKKTNEISTEKMAEK